MALKILRTVDEVRKVVSSLHSENKQIGFVPTMGFLHEGHLSLVKESKKNNDITIVSIFVNPTQFGENEDLDSYPRDFERDINLLNQLNTDYVFSPVVSEMYSSDDLTSVYVEKLSSLLCGISRPVHFKGVTTVVAKLINITEADNMYMGEKDFQQLLIINKMVKDMFWRVNVVGCPIVREEDGLAMSSRNKYLSHNEREKAVALYKSLKLAQKLYSEGIKESKQISEAMEKLISDYNGDVEYIKIIDKNSLQDVKTATGNERVVIAVRYGNTRLIDNMNLGS